MSYDIIVGDCRTELEKLPSESVDCVITSPPYYGLRDYGTGEWEGGDKDCTHAVGRATRGGDSAGNIGNVGSYKGGGDEAIKIGEPCPHCGAIRVDSQLGLESSISGYIENMVGVFREIKRVLKPTGTVWLNLGDSYVQGRGKATVKNMRLKPKNIMGIPFRVAFALQEDGWILRQDIIWAKPNPMPESIKDRCTNTHEYIFLLTKSNKYYFDYEAIKEPTIDGEGLRFKRSVWNNLKRRFKGAHFATFPHDLIEPCVLAGCPENGIILDPFAGSGTTAGVAEVFNRNSIMMELNEEYAKIIPSRIKDIFRIYGKSEKEEVEIENSDE